MYGVIWDELLNMEFVKVVLRLAIQVYVHLPVGWDKAQDDMW